MSEQYYSEEQAALAVRDIISAVDVSSSIHKLFSTIKTVTCIAFNIPTVLVE